MAFFKFRKGDDDAIAAPTQPESVEALRRRARQRLIGAAVLVLVGVVGFPLLFDTQPRPVAVDIPIDIPDRNKARPLAPPVAASTGPAPHAPATSGLAPQARPEAEPAPSVTPAQTATDAGGTARPEPRPPIAAASAARPEAATSAEEGARAKALLEGKPAQAQAQAQSQARDGDGAADGRFVVQVGAFADPAKAREVRLKLEKAGLKTYTHVAETKDGTRIRVRTGPFSSRAEADKAAQKVKGLELPAAILTL